MCQLCDQYIDMHSMVRYIGYFWTLYVTLLLVTFSDVTRNSSLINQ